LRAPTEMGKRGRIPHWSQPAPPAAACTWKEQVAPDADRREKESAEVCTSGVPQESSRFVYCRGGEVNRSVVATTLLANKSGSHRAVLPFLLSLVDGGDCAAHRLEISESLEIGQSPRRVGVQDAGQGIVVGQHRLHVVDTVH